MDVDYKLYAEGEALLGWLNAAVRQTVVGLNSETVLRSLAGEIQTQLAGADRAFENDPQP